MKTKFHFLPGFIFMVIFTINAKLIAQPNDYDKYNCRLVCCNNPCSQGHSSSCPYANNSSTTSGTQNNGMTKQDYDREFSTFLSEQSQKENQKGITYYNKKDWAKAAAHFKKATKLDPDNASYRTNLAYTNEMLQREKEKAKVKAIKPAKPINEAKLSYSESISNEQKKMETKTQTWVEYQKEQFNIRIKNPNKWCKKYYENLQKINEGKTLVDYFPNKKASQLEIGDVILIGPSSDTDYLSVKQANLDAWTNNNNAYVTHTVTCIKIVKGKKMFLDNQATEGPRIISEDEFKKRYSNRETSVAQMRDMPWGVAQPLKKDEGDKLWQLARELTMKNRDNTNPYATNYGLYGNDNMVCSESSWQLMNATGRYQIPFDKHIPRISGIDFSPASFYNSQQYFLITPLNMKD